jgi:hypothetical protein
VSGSATSGVSYSLNAPVPGIEPLLDFSLIVTIGSHSLGGGGIETWPLIDLSTVIAGVAYQLSAQTANGSALVFLPGGHTFISVFAGSLLSYSISVRWKEIEPGIWLRQTIEQGQVRLDQQGFWATANRDDPVPPRPEAPEPGSRFLIGSGSLLLAWKAYRRKQAHAPSRPCR